MKKEFIAQIHALKVSDVGWKVNQRLSEFSAFKNKDADEWFSELCFCILTANSKARTAMVIQNELGYAGFSTYSREALSESIRKNKHRFHNNKAEFIVSARAHLGINDKIRPFLTSADARKWLVENIRGLGYKEASHFLRNVGYFDLAVLDRHILNLMVENGVLDEKPKTLSPKKYLEIEREFRAMAKMLSMSCAELDLYMWSMKGGDVLK